MITFRKILDSVSDEDVLLQARLYNPKDFEEYVASYLTILDNLRPMNALEHDPFDEDKSDPLNHILLSYIIVPSNRDDPDYDPVEHHDEYNYVDVSGISNKGNLYGISYTHWGVWLNLPIVSEGFPTEISDAEKVYHCISEMSWGGLSCETVIDRKQGLIDQVNEIEESLAKGTLDESKYPVFDPKDYFK